MICETVNQESEIKAKRSAFVMYMEEGIEVVQTYFPGQLKYVEANRNKSLQQVFTELQGELKLVAEN